MNRNDAAMWITGRQNPHEVHGRCDSEGHCIRLLVIGFMIGLFWGSSSAIAQNPANAALSRRTPQEFRLPDDRPVLTDEMLTDAGLRQIRSRRLILVTDATDERVAALPPLADTLFETLESNLGTLRPAHDGAEFQLTGFLVGNKERFESAGLLPPQGFEFRHGRNLGYRFWLNDQTSDYYRRHLLLHEFVHCFMMCEFGMTDIPPLWYTEGIAEYFATHRIADPISKSQFGICPDSITGFEGWGRIKVLHNELTVGRETSILTSPIAALREIRFPADNTFLADSKYAQAWALVWLIRTHPELQPHFAPLAEARSRQQFAEAEAKASEAVWHEASVIWPLLVDSLIEGFDVERSFPVAARTVDNRPNRSDGWTVDVRADREWQDSGVMAAEGDQIIVSCRGRYVMHDQPKDWESEPQGITIDYFRGRPLGEITGMLVSTDGQKSSLRIPIGTGRSLKAPFAGKLWLQINDSAASRADNRGVAQVQIQR
jgi:hypothetical protein